MRLITAIAALALLAGSMDVEAQKRGKVGLPGDSDDDAPQIALAPQIAPVAHMAIGAFGVLDPEERKGLAEAAEGGDGEALQELRANHVEAIEAMLGALEDPASRKLIELGMILAQNLWIEGGQQLQDGKVSLADNANEPILNVFAGLSMGEAFWDEDPADGMLNMVEEQLQMQLDNFIMTSNAQGLKGSKHPNR